MGGGKQHRSRASAQRILPCHVATMARGRPTLFGVTDEKTTRPRRRWLFLLLALVVLGGLLALALRHYTQPEKLTALLIGQAHDLLGADLSIHGAAGFSFAPKLRVTLPQPSLQGAGARAAWLHADALHAVVPWRTLWSGTHEIERIDLVKPVLDLDAFSAWLAAQPATTTPPPDLRFSLHVEDGTITAAGTAIAQHLNMDFKSTDNVAAWLARIGAEPAGLLLPPLGGSADASSVRIGDTLLEGVHVEISDDNPASRQPQ